MNRWIQLPRRNGLLVDDLIDNGGDVVAGKGLFPGHHFVEDHAEAEQIRAAIQRLALYLLR